MALRVVEKEISSDAGPSRAHVQAPAREADSAGSGPNVELLRSFVERIARLHEERKSIADDIADVIKEATSQGFDKHVLKDVVRIFMQDPDKREKRREDAEILDIYLNALGIN